MKRTNSNNWIFTICIILTAIVLAFLSFIPINIEFIKPFIVYFDPTKLLSNLPLWIFINSIIALYSHSERTSMLNTTLFNIVCFVSYCLFSMILTHTMPKEMFLTWFVFTLIWAIFAYLVWSANRQDTKGWILSTILLAILSFPCLQENLVKTRLTKGMNRLYRYFGQFDTGQFHFHCNRKTAHGHFCNLKCIGPISSLVIHSSEAQF